MRDFVKQMQIRDFMQLTNLHCTENYMVQILKMIKQFYCSSSPLCSFFFIVILTNHFFPSSPRASAAPETVELIAHQAMLKLLT